ncbi:MAG: metallophosphoesterase, partial [Calditrichota bacterium]
YDPEEYRITNLLNEDSLRTENPRFLVTGDTQRGWRINEKFIRKKNWKSKWQALFPFYQLYLLGNGITGGIRYMAKRPYYHPDFRSHMRSTLLDASKSRNSDFLVILGDLCASDGTRPLHWKYFLDETRRQSNLASELPLVTVPGNHDRTGNPDGEANYKAVFNRPNFYTLEFKDAVLICLDSNYLVDQKDDIPDDRQDSLFTQYFVSSDSTSPSWLERQLATYADKSFKIIAMHHPAVSFGKHFTNWLQRKYGNNLNEKRIQFIDLLLENNVQVIFTGHEHLYEHNVIKRDQARPDLAGKELHVVISSSGGVPLRSTFNKMAIRQREGLLKRFGIDGVNLKQVSDWHYTEVAVLKDSLQIETWIAPRNKEKSQTLLERIVFFAGSADQN